MDLINFASFLEMAFALNLAYFIILQIHEGRYEKFCEKRDKRQEDLRSKLPEIEPIITGQPVESPNVAAWFKRLQQDVSNEIADLRDSKVELFVRVSKAGHRARYGTTKSVIGKCSSWTVLPAACLAMALIIMIGVWPDLQFNGWAITVLACFLIAPVPCLLIYSHCTWEIAFKAFTKDVDTLEVELETRAQARKEEVLAEVEKMLEEARERSS